MNRSISRLASKVIPVTQIFDGEDSNSARQRHDRSSIDPSGGPGKLLAIGRVAFARTSNQARDQSVEKRARN